MKTVEDYLKLIPALAITFLGLACANVKFSTTGYNNKNDGPVTPFSNPPVCETDGGGNNPDSGLQGDIYYLDQTQPRYQNVDDYISFGHRLNNPLFLSQLNVPTRMFETGFQIDGGDLVRDEQNNVLIEYFALDLYSELRLTPQDAPGNYQLALISDDASKLDAKISGDVYTTVVDNDGQHPTRLGCGSVVTMNADTRLPIRVKYDQGPRYHIALMMLWRKVEGSTPPAEPLCDLTGNETWFDPSNQQPTSNFQELTVRGWQIVKANNFKLPGNRNNPCL